MTPPWQHIVKSVRHPAIPLERVFVFPHSIRPPSAISSRLPDGINGSINTTSVVLIQKALHTPCPFHRPLLNYPAVCASKLTQNLLSPPLLHHSLFPFLSAAQSQTRSSITLT